MVILPWTLLSLNYRFKGIPLVARMNITHDILKRDHGWPKICSMKMESLNFPHSWVKYIDITSTTSTAYLHVSIVKHLLEPDQWQGWWSCLTPYQSWVDLGLPRMLTMAVVSGLNWPVQPSVISKFHHFCEVYNCFSWPLYLKHVEQMPFSARCFIL